jgi:SAM-dependent methyltransferase
VTIVRAAGVGAASLWRGLDDDSQPSIEDRARWVQVSELGSRRLLEVPVRASTRYLTHGLFRYVGKLPPPLVSYLLARYTKQGDLVADPMCGGGTTAIEAISSGRKSWNADPNPVAVLITTALSNSADPHSFLPFAEQVVARYEPSDPPTNLAPYFSAKTFGLLKYGLDFGETPAEKALMLSIVRKASNANTKKINTVVDPDKLPRDAAPLLLAAAQAFASAFHQFNATRPQGSHVETGVATDLTLKDASTDFVLLHPPYLTNTAFSEVTQLQLELLGFSATAMRKKELAYRGSYFHVPDGLKKYMLGWNATLKESFRILRKGGLLAVVVGDGNIDRVRIPVASITQEFCEDIGFSMAERAIHKLNNQTGWTLSRKMTEQHLLVFGK